MILQPRLSSSRAVLEPSLSNLAAAFNSLALCPRHAGLRPQFSTTSIRYASHAAQGRANGPKDSAGRRLGAKKTSSEYVIPGNIIFKQRGTKWFPGENVGMGKDHTIYATEYGYVRYYRNPTLHPKRRYIGVALEKEGAGSRLPTPPNAPTRRRLGMYAAPMNTTISEDHVFLENHLSENSLGAEDGLKAVSSPLPLSKSGSGPATYWTSNYEVGKAAEKKGIVVRDFDRKDRWLAWRKRTKKTKEKLLARAAKATRKTKGKKSNKGAPTPTKRN